MEPRVTTKNTTDDVPEEIANALKMLCARADVPPNTDFYFVRHSPSPYGYEIRLLAHQDRATFLDVAGAVGTSYQTAMETLVSYLQKTPREWLASVFSDARPVGNVNNKHVLLVVRGKDTPSAAHKGYVATNDILQGEKHDYLKPEHDLLPPRALESVVDVLTYGARKYARDNWKFVENARSRYYNAAQRHLGAWRRGEKVDSESGFSHLAHAACSILFLLAFEVGDVEEKPE